MSTRLYLRSDLIEDNGVPIYETNEVVGSPTEEIQARTNEGDYLTAFVFRAFTDSGLSGNEFPVSANISTIDGNVEGRFVLVHRDSSGNIKTTGESGITIDSVGVYTATLILDSTFLDNEIIDLEFEVRRTGGHGNVDMFVSTQDTDSYIDLPTIETASGGSQATVNITTTGNGIKTTSGFSTSDVIISTTQQGFKSIYDGSSASILITTTGEGIGVETHSGGSSTGITISASGGGFKRILSSSESIIEITSQGDGIKSTSNGSSAEVIISTTQLGIPSKFQTSPSESIIVIDTNVLGFKSIYNSFQEEININSQGDGYKLAFNGSSSLINISSEGDGITKRFSQESGSIINIDAESSGIKKAFSTNSNVTIIINARMLSRLPRMIITSDSAQPRIKFGRGQQRIEHRNRWQ